MIITNKLYGMIAFSYIFILSPRQFCAECKKVAYAKRERDREREGEREIALLHESYKPDFQS